MKNIAPDIFRQRLLIEAYYSIDITKEIIENYFTDIIKHLNLRSYGKAAVFSPAKGLNREGNEGFDAFIPLIDSGISIYVWSPAKFLSILIYTCKQFDEKSALDFTKQFFQISGDIEQLSF